MRRLSDQAHLYRPILHEVTSEGQQHLLRSLEQIFGSVAVRQLAPEDRDQLRAVLWGAAWKALALADEHYSKSESSG